MTLHSVVFKFLFMSVDIIIWKGQIDINITLFHLFLNVEFQIVQSVCPLNFVCVGSKNWLNWRREIELLSDLSYFSLTTLSGIHIPNTSIILFLF